MEYVILVDEQDNEMGTMEKMEAHRQGVLHRAFSIFIFNSKGELLIQKRSKTKYHSAGLWTNTCCSHPRPGETIERGAHRRLHEEMGIDVPLSLSYKFIYKVQLENNLTEHELDYVFTGKFEGTPEINVAEADEWKYLQLSDLQMEINKKPAEFTHWFKIILKDFEKRQPTI